MASITKKNQMHRAVMAELEDPISTGESRLSPPITTGTPNVFHLPGSLTYQDGAELPTFRTKGVFFKKCVHIL